MYLSGETAIFGIIGDPITHSFSPAMQTIAFQHCNYNAVYVPFEIQSDDLQKVIESLEILNISGINVTAPYKKAIIHYLDVVSPEAQILQSVNTIYKENDKWHGCSTDGQGFVQSLDSIKCEIQNKNIQVIGSGGAAQAIIYALAQQKPAKIWITNRTVSKSLDLIEKYQPLFPEVEFINGICEDEINILINTTSIGTDNRSISAPLDLIERSQAIVDIIYHIETPLIKKAKQLNKIALDGLSMLLYQGALSFELWTKQQAPINIMQDCLLQLRKD